LNVQKAKQGFKLVKWVYRKEIEIPEDWEIQPVKELTQIQVTDGPHETPNFLSRGIPFLSVDNIQENKITLDNLRYISEDDHKKFSKKCKPKKNDLLLGKAASVGKVALIDLNFEFNIWSPLALIRFKREYNPSFFYYFFQGIFLQKQITRFVNAGTQPNIGMIDIKKLQCLIPPIKEQEKIAVILSNVDKSIQNTHELIEQTQRLKKGLMQKLLTKGIGHTKFKKIKWLFRKEIEIPNDWELMKYSEISKKILDGEHNSPSFVDNGIPYISARHVKNKILFEDCKFVSEEVYKELIQRCHPELNDLLLTVKGTIGVCKKIDIGEKFVMDRNVGLLKLKTELVEPDFIEELTNFSLVQQQIHSFIDLSVISSLYLKNIKKIKLPIPSLKEQKQITSILSNINSKIQKLEKNKSNLELLKKGLMQNLLTGKIRIK